MAGHRAPKWHQCKRWNVYDMPCPFASAEGEEEDPDGDARTAPRQAMISKEAALVVELAANAQAERSNAIVKQEGRAIYVPVDAGERLRVGFAQPGSDRYVSADALQRSEEAVAANARNIGVAVGGAVALSSLYDMVRSRSRLRSVAANAALGAGVQIRALQGGYKGGGMGFHFPAIYDARKAWRVR